MVLGIRGLTRAAFGVGALFAVSCASPQSEGGKGGECYRIEDCQEGLVCVKNVCTSDLKSIAGKAPVGSTGGAAGAAAGKEAGTPADGATARGGAPGAAGGGSGSGGTPSAGGAPGAGGTSTASGGAEATGGNPATGGVTGTGTGGA